MHGPAFSSVTGTAWPSSRNTCDIPIFLPRIPGLIVPLRRGRACPAPTAPDTSQPSFPERLDLHIHARRQVELHQRVHRLLRRLQYVQQPFVRPDFKLLPRLLVHVRGAQYRRDTPRRRQRNGTGHRRSGPLRGVHNLRGRLIEHPVIVCFQADAYAFSKRHNLPWAGLPGLYGPGMPGLYFITSVTVPAPTVRPPSRIAKRSPLSMATGVINSTFRSTVSPGITISVPSGNSATPVTSVVRK